MLETLTRWISFIPNLPAREVAVTLVLIVGFAIVRFILVRLMRGNAAFLSDDRRKLITNVKNAIFFLGLFALLLVWAPSLRTFALSLTAFVVAIVVATKELILCITGAIVRTTADAFSVGDWIEVGGQFGEVIDQNLMAVTIQELHAEGPIYTFTGRTVVIPNSQFLTSSVRNSQFHKRFVFHTFFLICDVDIDHQPVEKAVTTSLKKSMHDQIDLANRYLSMIERRAGLDLLNADPYHRITMMPDGRMKLTFTAFLPTAKAIEFEQAAVDAGLKTIRRLKQKPPQGGSPAAG
ncbi:mechanosensitive ion channel family protein [Magnetofaba australis]|uniref:Small-conductance mechanosensitive channel n=1 Tax=Magnetofaba australis IT-1 TaxID=1434232 RepID=A0A1Y2K5F3_9PROT|nr:mechanosensitive ion channel domain-containing protein [Magnetofaba australis]OSM04859.1 putative small-conductance mechanosensitive channel [Magnetofaba australis IT-1]